MRSLLGRLVAGVCIAVVGMTTTVSAKPKIHASVKEYDADTIVEGKKESVTYTFHIKNTGDEVLTIKSVRPG